MQCQKCQAQVFQSQSYCYRCGQLLVIAINNPAEDKHISSNVISDGVTVSSTGIPIPRMPTDYKSWSILATILSFMACQWLNLPFSIAAIVYSQRAINNYKLQKFSEAESASKIARNLLIFCVAFTAAWFLFFFIYYQLHPSAH